MKSILSYFFIRLSLFILAYGENESRSIENEIPENAIKFG